MFSINIYSGYIFSPRPQSWINQSVQQASHQKSLNFLCPKFPSRLLSHLLKLSCLSCLTKVSFSIWLPSYMSIITDVYLHICLDESVSRYSFILTPLTASHMKATQCRWSRSESGLRSFVVKKKAGGALVIMRKRNWGFPFCNANQTLSIRMTEFRK